MRKTRILRSLYLGLALSASTTLSVSAEVISHPGNAVLGNIDNRTAIYSATDFSNNEITVTAGGAPVQDVYGGYTKTSGTNLDNNRLSVSGVTLEAVYGGRTVMGNVTNTTVTITDSNITNFYGTSQANNSNASGNIFNINNSNVRYLMGVYIMSGTINNNVMHINGGVMQGAVTFTRAIGDGIISGNILNIHDATFKDYVDGVELVTGSAENNVINISGNTVANNAITVARSVSTAELKNNVLNIYSGTLSHVYAASARNTVGNIVNMSGGSVGFVYGGYNSSTKSGTTLNNEVNISGGLATGVVYGGRNNGGAAQGNKVRITGTGTTQNYIFGGYSNGTNTTDHALFNEVVISTSGTVAEEIYGGRSNAGAAKNNTVTITGGQIAAPLIVGGYSMSGDSYENTVNISGAASLSANTSIYGGLSQTGNVYGNTLNLNWQGSVAEVANFENYNFALTENTIADSTLLTVDTASDVTDSNIKLVGSSSTHDWQAGEQVTLLSQSNGVAKLNDGQLEQGVIKMYDYKMSQDNATGAIQVTFDGVKSNPKSEVINTGVAASIGLLAASETLTDNLDTQERIFAATKHSRTKLDLGSNDTTVQATSMIVGASHKIEHTNSDIILSGFIEGGWGNYNTHGQFAQGDVYSSGKTEYYGLGLMASNNRKDGVYSKGVIRLGHVSTDFKSNELIDGVGGSAKYDVGSLYYGISLGMGKIIKLNAKNDLDLYGKYTWTHQNGTSVNILGDKFDFDAIDSHRLRVGARLQHKSSKAVTTYFDLAYEHEFAATAKASMGSLRVPEVSMSGGTCIAEIGLMYKPKQAEDFLMQFGIQGYSGERKGFSGNMQFKWLF